MKFRPSLRSEHTRKAGRRRFEENPEKSELVRKCFVDSERNRKKLQSLSFQSEKFREINRPQLKMRKFKEKKLNNL